MKTRSGTSKSQPQHKFIPLPERLSKTTHFNFDECKALISFHHALEESGPLNRVRMREIIRAMFHISDTVMLDLTFDAFDRDKNNLVDIEEFVSGISIMLRGTLTELIEWCYFVYDINCDGNIGREEITYCLRGCIMPGYGGLDQEEAEEAERDIIDIALKLLDKDRDGYISKNDFTKAARADPLLLVGMGQCLPTIKSCASLLGLITEDFRSYALPYGAPEKGGRSSSGLLKGYSGDTMTSERTTITMNSALGDPISSESRY